MGEVKQKRKKECKEDYKVYIIHDKTNKKTFEEVIHGKEFKDIVRSLLLEYPNT